MTDRADSTRKFTSSQASTGGASFTGIDGLVLEADMLEVAINQGIAVPAYEGSTLTENTVYVLGIFQDTVGTLTFDLAGDISLVEISRADSNTDIIAKVTGALESLAGVDAGNVTVTGSRIAGFSIEFNGALSGSNVAELTVSTTAAAVNADVSETRSSETAVDEKKLISINTPRTSNPVVIDVIETVEAVAELNEIKRLVFTSPRLSSGFYNLRIGDEDYFLAVRTPRLISRDNYWIWTVLDTSEATLPPSFLRTKRAYLRY